MSATILEAIDREISIYAHRDLISSTALLDVLLDLRLLVAAEDELFLLVATNPIPESALA